MTLNPVAQIGSRRTPEWTFGDRLRKARTELRLKQDEMAARLNVKRSTYEAWETGRNKPDVTDLAPRLEEATGYSRLWFVGWMDEGTTPDPGSRVTGVYRNGHKPQKTGGIVTPLRGRVSLTSDGEGSESEAA